MAELLQEAFKHQHIYVPRGTEKDSLPLGRRIGLGVARYRRADLTVLSVQKGGATAHPELAKLHIVTERSGSVSDGGVVLAWCPRSKTLEKLRHVENSVIVLVEWIPGEMAAWARLRRAYNVVTGEVMESGLSADAIELLDGVVAEGYNGWTKSTDVTMTKSYLEHLFEVGAYDRDLVLAYARQTKNDVRVERLAAILVDFERSLPSASSVRARRWDL